MLFTARLTGVSTILILTVLAVVLFRYSSVLSAWIARDDADISIVVDARTMLVVGLAVFGATLIVDGVLELGQTLYARLTPRTDPSGVPSFMLERRWTSIIRGGLEVAIGVTLFMGRDAMLRSWRRLRSQET